MVKLRDKGTGADLGSISDEELQYIIDQMDEDSPDDTDYHISRAVLSTMKAVAAPSSLTDLLETSMGDRDGFDVEWLEE
jgi:processive 1,2-diacylglycerol beta-glucosyltransferase